MSAHSYMLVCLHPYVATCPRFPSPTPAPPLISPSASCGVAHTVAERHGVKTQCMHVDERPGPAHHVVAPESSQMHRKNTSRTHLERSWTCLEARAWGGRTLQWGQGLSWYAQFCVRSTACMCKLCNPVCVTCWVQMAPSCVSYPDTCANVSKNEVVRMRLGMYSAR